MVRGKESQNLPRRASRLKSVSELERKCFEKCTSMDEKLQILSVASVWPTELDTDIVRFTDGLVPK